MRPTRSNASDFGGMSSKRSKRSTTDERKHERRHTKCKVVTHAFKRFFVYVMAGAAIASSTLAIYSCNFFSYRDTAEPIDAANNGIKSRVKNNLMDYRGSDRREQSIYVDVLSYAPFEDLPEAGVGLFSYFMGDSSDKGNFMSDDVCFRYYDEVIDYKLFMSNHHEGLKPGKKVDLWLVARWCSILAPIVAFLAFVQLVLEWFCGCRLARCGSLVTTFFFLSAGVLQFGTFAVAFAPPTMASDAPVGDEQFCFAAQSTIQCRVDTGAWLSLGSAVSYIVLAFLSVAFKTTHHVASNNERDKDSKNKQYCGGCCIISRNGYPKSLSKSKNRRGVPGDTSSGSSFGTGLDFDNDDFDDLHSKRSRKSSKSSNNKKNDQTSLGVPLGKEDNRKKVKKQKAGEEIGYDGDDDTCMEGGLDKNQIRRKDDNSIAEDESIETNIVHAVSAWCYCMDEPESPNQKIIDIEKGLVETKTRSGWTMENDETTTFEDEEATYTDEKENATRALYVVNEGPTVEQCEASFMAEFEKSQYGLNDGEYSSLKVVEFVRS